MEFDVAILGGGLAGSLAAAMLGRTLAPAALIDPHGVYPADFRCEKIDGLQLATLRKTGLADAVLSVATHDGEAWIARYGRVVEKRPGDQHGILYPTLVNRLRKEIRKTAFIEGKAAEISTTRERQTVRLTNGETLTARLVVLANGLSLALRDKLGLTRPIVSRCHSISAGFDIRAAGAPGFPFPALTYYPESPADGLAYLSLFPIGSTVRANLMTYRDMEDPWLRDLRHRPKAALLSVMPRLQNVTGDFEVVGPVKIRPVDLYVTENHRQPGVVIVGDAFATSCPAAGTGAGKVFTDVERLCNEHIPRWLATPGMGEEKIAAFYDDPVKRASDARSFNKAFHLRSLSTDAGLPWRLRRGARVVKGVCLSLLRAPRRRTGGGANGFTPAPAASKALAQRSPGR